MMIALQVFRYIRLKTYWEPVALANKLAFGLNYCNEFYLHFSYPIPTLRYIYIFTLKPNYLMFWISEYVIVQTRCIDPKTRTVFIVVIYTNTDGYTVKKQTSWKCIILLYYLYIYIYCHSTGILNIMI